MNAILLLIDSDGKWRRYWPDFTPALVSAPIEGDDPLTDINALSKIAPSLAQPKPPGDEYTIARVIPCDRCEAMGVIKGICHDPVDNLLWESEEPCGDCGGDGLYRVLWSKIPSSTLFPANRRYSTKE